MSNTKNLIRLLAKSAVGFCLLPSLAFAVGFGGISINSKLGEPLDIEVELLSVSPTEIGTMEVNFASRADFARAGVAYPEFGAALKFDIVEGVDRQYYISITSDNPINETFLHFLISANWSGGKAIREYTALMDPPLYSGQPASVVDVPVVVNQLEEEASVDLVSQDSSSQPDSATSSVSVVSGDTLSGIVNRLALPDSITRYQAFTALLEANPEAFVKNNMNRLKAGATLSVPTFGSISNVSQSAALQNYQQQVSTYSQYLVEIGYSNDSESTSSSEVSTTEVSTTEVSTTEVSTTEVSTTDGSEETQSITELSESINANLDLSEEESIDLSGLSELSANIETEETDDEAQLRIAQETSDEELTSALVGDQGDDAQVAALKSQLAELDESLFASGIENEEVKQRLKDIQTQVERVSRLIEIEDTNLAASQENASKDNSEATVTNETTSEDDEVVATIASIEQTTDGGEVGVLDADESGNLNSTETSSPTTEEATKVASAIASSAATTESTPVESDLLAAVSTENSTAEVAAENDSTNNNSDGTSGSTRSVVTSGIMSNISNIFGSFSDYGLKILAGLIALIAGLFFYRRRKSQQEFEESMLDIESGQFSTDTAQDSFKQVSAASGIDLASRDSGFELTVGGGMSYLSEEGVAGVAEEENEVIQVGAVDPLAEADVYLAYDRDEQAIQVLKEAYSVNPERVELAEKLLEIYHKQDERVAFDQLATELRSRIGAKHHPVWTKVSAMGREVSPDNSLFNKSSELHTFSEGSEIELDSGPMDLQSTAQVENEITGISPPLNQSGMMDIQLDELNLGDGQSEDSAIKNLELGDLGLDGDMDALDYDGGIDAPTLSQIITAAEVKELGEKLAAVDVDIDELEASFSEIPKSDDITLIMGDYDELNVDVSSQLSNTLQEIENEKRDVAEAFSEHINEPKIKSADSTGNMGREDSYLSELSEQSINKMEPYHESETALELAKAYLELGEKDIAKGFIEEVINDGSDKQKAKAEKLVKELVS